MNMESVKEFVLQIGVENARRERLRSGIRRSAESI